MARPRRRRRNPVSLFPFLSVLACIIGVLTLLITATAVGEIGGGAIDLETFERLEAEIPEGRRRLARLEALGEEVASLEAAREDETALRAELAVRRDALAERARESATLREPLRASEARVEALEARIATLRDERERLDERLRRRRQALATAPLRIQPSGSGVGIEPHFAECRGDRVRLFTSPGREPVEVAQARVAASLEVRAFLRRVRAASGASAILLMRPSGVAACRALEREARRHGARNGAMPIPEDGELDFSALGGEG